MVNTTATNAIGVTIAGGGNGNGRLDNPANDPAVFDENNAAWEQLSKAGFIQGSFAGTAGQQPLFNNNLAPVNAFNNPMLLGVTADYQDTATAVARLHLVIGRGIPVQILRELDVKVDDGVPDTGVLRATLQVPSVFKGTDNWGGSDASVTCVNGSIYDVASNSPDCNGVFIF